MVFSNNILLGASAQSSGYVIEGSGLGNGTSTRVYWTPSGAGDRQQFVIQFIAKFNKSGSDQTIALAGASGTDFFQLILDSDNKIKLNLFASSSTAGDIDWAPVFQDATAYSDFALYVDTTAQSAKLFQNGVELAKTTVNAITLNLQTQWNNTVVHSFGQNHIGSSQFCDMYFGRLANLDGFTGTDPETDGFGETDSEGYWVIKDISGLTFGTNGRLYEGGTNIAAGTDTSGLSNSATIVGITATNDSPTDDATNGYGNYCTWNPNDKNSNVTLGGGNLYADFAAQRGVRGTIAVSSGKWYWEVEATTVNDNKIGILSTGSSLASDPSTDSGLYAYEHDGQKNIAGSSSAYGSSYTTGDNIAIALDLDNNAIWFGKESGGTVTWQNSATQSEIEAGTTTNAATASIAAGTYAPTAICNSAADVTANFGQTAFGATPPSGFKALNTASLEVGDPNYVAGVAQLRAGAQVQSNTLTTDSTGWTGFGIRQEVPASAITDQSFTRVRVRLEVAAATTGGFDNVYIGTKAASGNAWDFAGDQVRLTFFGNNGIDLTAGGKVWSDWVAFSGDGTDNLIIAFDPDSANDDFRYSSTSGYNQYTKSGGAGEAGTTAPTGYGVNSNQNHCVITIEVQ